MMSITDVVFRVGAVSSFTFWLVVVLVAPTAEGGISCFKCSSRNGSDIGCEDPFHPAMDNYYMKECMVPKQGHVGQFPASFCVKVIGTVYGTGEKMVIRTCTLATMDNQCGEFNFEGQSMSGCILSCSTDGCNSASNFVFSPFFLFAGTLFVVCSHFKFLA